MRTGKCPKCNSQEVYLSEDGGGIGGHELSVEVKNGGPRITYKWQTCLCATCGYYENYLLDRQMIASIKTNPKKEGWKKLDAHSL